MTLEERKKNWESAVDTFRKVPLSLMTMEQFDFVREKGDGEEFYTEERIEKITKLLINATISAIGAMRGNRRPNS